MDNSIELDPQLPSTPRTPSSVYDVLRALLGDYSTASRCSNAINSRFSARSDRPKRPADRARRFHWLDRADRTGTKVDAIPTVKQDFTQETVCTNVNYPRQDSKDPSKTQEITQVSGEALQKAVQSPKFDANPIPTPLSEQDLLRETVRAHMQGDIE